MFSRIRKRITYANVVLTLALVFAMTGGAYAAGKIIITSRSQIKASVLKSLTGKTGATGPAGSAGPQGATGATGAAGATGSQGLQGTEGKEGKQGTQGAPGQEGQPWTDGGTLPAGKTEVGAWAVGKLVIGASEELEAHVPISFNIPLASEIESSKAHYVTKTEWESKTAPAECEGTPEIPTAEAGSLCVYEGISEEIHSAILINPGATSGSGKLGAGTTGADLKVTAEAPEGEKVTGRGTWAVTAAKES